MEIVKNPIIIGLLAGTVTYMYMNWSIENSDYEKDEYDIVLDESGKKQKVYKKPEVNLLIPLLVALIGWFITYAYFEHQPTSQVFEQQPMNSNTFVAHNNIRHELPLPIPPTKSYTFAKDVIDSISSDPKSFSLINKGINIPTNLPDVMIDMI